MKKISIASFLFLVVSISVYAQTDTIDAQQRLIDLQRQMVDLQKSIDEVQSTITAATAHKDIIPTEHKNDSRFYASLKFGLFYSNDGFAYNDSKSTESLGKHFSYSLKPAFGYLVSPRFSVGCTLIYADCKFSGLTQSSMQYIMANAMLGGGVSLSDYLTWRVEPYARYKICKLFWERFNLWGEFTVYAGQMIPRDSQTHKLQENKKSLTYGVRLRPMVTIDLNQNMMLFSSLEFIAWNGSCQMGSDGSLYNNSINFQFIPIYNIFTGLFNMGVIRRF